MHNPAIRISHREDIKKAANTLANIIKEVVEEVVPVLKPTPYTKQWWTKELMELKREKNRLSN